MAKCKLLAKDESDAALWNVLDAANQLRNTIAHGLSVEKIAEKMKQLKERCLPDRGTSSGTIRSTRRLYCNVHLLDVCRIYRNTRGPGARRKTGSSGGSVIGRLPEALWLAMCVAVNDDYSGAELSSFWRLHGNLSNAGQLIFRGTLRSNTCVTTIVMPAKAARVSIRWQVLLFL